jgi:hypothetical protein
MGAVTYPNAEVEQYLNQHFIPVQYNVADQPEVIRQFHSAWTPTIIVQDASGVERRRSQGYLDARRFLGEVSLARLQDALDRQDWEEAKKRLDDAVNFTRGDPAREPEAMYWAAVVDYKTSKDATGLMSGWEKLLNAFPESEWAKRAEFIRR